MSEAPPLAGRRVVVTRAEGPEGPLSRELRALGAEVLHWPAVHHLAPEDPGPLADALARLADFDWVVFTSPRAVQAVVDRGRWPAGGPQVAAVGERTARTLEAAGWPVEITAEPARGSALVRAMGELGCAGCRVLFPASEIARETIPEGLTGLGAEVHRVTAYRTVPTALDRSRCEQLIGEGVAAVTFASPSAVESLERALGPDLFLRLLEEALVAAIGPTTDQALARLHRRADAVAQPSDLSSLARAVAASLPQPLPTRRS